MFVLIRCKLYIIYAFTLQMQTLINYLINEAQHRGNKVCFYMLTLSLYFYCPYFLNVSNSESHKVG